MNGYAAGDRTVADAMVPMRDGCVPMNRVDDVLEMVDALSAVGMPVSRSFDTDEMLGVVLREDLARASDTAGATRVVDLPWQPVVAVRPDAPLSSIADASGPVRVVLDEQGSLVGVLAAVV